MDVYTLNRTIAQVMVHRQHHLHTSVWNLNIAQFRWQLLAKYRIVSTVKWHGLYVDQLIYIYQKLSEAPENSRLEQAVLMQVLHDLSWQLTLPILCFYSQFVNHGWWLDFKCLIHVILYSFQILLLHCRPRHFHLSPGMGMLLGYSLFCISVTLCNQCQKSGQFLHYFELGNFVLWNLWL